MIRRSIAFLVLALSGCDYGQHNPPERKSGIPETAVWAGGVDGGSWIQCTREHGIEYSCAIYNDYTGHILAKGTFLHRKLTYDADERKTEVVSLEGQQKLPPYVHYDGIFIHLAGEEALVPDGIIMSPFDHEHGKKQQFTNGKEVGDEVQY